MQRFILVHDEGFMVMTQEERWLTRYNEVKSFVENNKRRPSKYAPEERNAWNWLRHTQKQYGAGELKAESSCIAAESRNYESSDLRKA